MPVLDRLRIALGVGFLATPMLPEVSTGTRTTGADSSFSKCRTRPRILDAHDEVFLVRLSTYLPCLSVTSTGSITYSAPALSAKVGGSCSGACACAFPWAAAGAATRIASSARSPAIRVRTRIRIRIRIRPAARISGEKETRLTNKL
jgi:hypothetical protein